MPANGETMPGKIPYFSQNVMLNGENMRNNEELFTKKNLEERLKSGLAESELTIIKQRDKISELKREIIKLEKEKDIIDNRELQVSDAIEKYKNRAHYIENVTKSRLDLEIAKLENVISLLNANFADFPDCGKNELEAIAASLKSLVNEIADASMVTKEKIIADSPSFDSLQERYHRLLNIYAFASAETGEKRRGRPKKEPTTIETFLKQKKAESERQKQSQFDLDEALNPVDSLENIMSDIIKND